MTDVTAEKYSEGSLQKSVSILLADDHPLMRKALRVTLENEPDFNIIAEANNGEDAVNLANQLQPNIIIMDVSMPVMNGLEATREIKEKYPQIAVLALTVHDDTEHVLKMLESGAAGYLTKNIFDQELVNALRSIVSGETVLESHIFKDVLKHAFKYLKKPVVTNSNEKFSVRDIEILKLVARGLSNQAIAAELKLSFPTIKAYMVGIFSKLNVASRTEAVIAALRDGLLTNDDIQ